MFPICRLSFFHSWRFFAAVVEKWPAIFHWWTAIQGEQGIKGEELHKRHLKPRYALVCRIHKRWDYKIEHVCKDTATPSINCRSSEHNFSSVVFSGVPCFRPWAEKFMIFLLLPGRLFRSHTERTRFMQKNAHRERKSLRNKRKKLKEEKNSFSAQTKDTWKKKSQWEPKPSFFAVLLTQISFGMLVGSLLKDVCSKYLISFYLLCHKAFWDIVVCSGCR